MAAPETSLPPDDLEDRAAIAFLERFVDDRTHAAWRPLAAYLGLFPGFEARIAREWLALVGPAAPPAVPLAAGGPPTRQDHCGPYRLERELGRGAQGVVYLAEDTRLGRKVALKVLSTDLSALSGPATLRLQREAEAIARLDHPGIATVYETGRSEQFAWIAMAYVPGGSLATAIQTRLTSGLGPPQVRAELDRVVRIVQRAAEALAAAHRVGILHRDIKPANVLLRAADEPVLVDFGLAADVQARTPTLTVPGALFGTLAYLPPERLAGAAADERTDVYALGVVLFELLTLRRPYAHDVMAHELLAIERAPLPDVRAKNPAVPADLAVVVATALAKNPLDRYADAAAFAADLGRVLALQPIAARPSPPWVRLHRWIQRNRALAGSLGGILLALALGLAATLWSWQTTRKALDDVKRLADLKLARDLEARAELLWPARPERLPELHAWHDEHAVLHGRLATHQARAAALPPDTHDPALAWEQEQLTLLLAAHDRLAALATDVDRRITTASGLEAASRTGPAAVWQAASARIASNPRYHGLHLPPQLGLLPLGPDPHSGLEEFAHLLSGPPASRDPASGALQCREDTGIVLVLVPGGPARLGADRLPPADGRAANVDPDTPKEQEPTYTVTLAPYFLSRFEMTQAQWQQHTGKNPATYRIDGGLTRIQSRRHPIELVTWEQCDTVLRQLDLCLPTEAQWESAYRAGTTTPWPHGLDVKSLQGHENLADITARDRGTNRRLRFIDWLDDGCLVHAPVGSFAPNAWGFHDCGGNVKEWCDDSWEDYPAVAPRAGDGRRRGNYDEYRIVRGGSFSSYVDEARAAHRSGVQKHTAGAEAGVRPARRIE